MLTLTSGVAFFLLLNLSVAMVLVARRSGAADRMLAALLFGTTGVALLMLAAAVLDLPASVDVALVLALLAAIAGIAFARRAWTPSPRND